MQSYYYIFARLKIACSCSPTVQLKCINVQFRTGKCAVNCSVFTDYERLVLVVAYKIQVGGVINNIVQLPLNLFLQVCFLLLVFVPTFVRLVTVSPISTSANACTTANPRRRRSQVEVE